MARNSWLVIRGRGSWFVGRLSRTFILPVFGRRAVRDCPYISTLFPGDFWFVARDSWLVGPILQRFAKTKRYKTAPTS